MHLFFGQNGDELVEIGDTSATEKLQQLVITVTWLQSVDQVFSLRPRDTSTSSKLVQKRMVWVNAIQQMNTIER